MYSELVKNVILNSRSSSRIHESQIGDELFEFSIRSWPTLNTSRILTWRPSLYLFISRNLACYHRTKGVLGDSLVGTKFANDHCSTPLWSSISVRLWKPLNSIHNLTDWNTKEVESTGAHTQFYDNSTSDTRYSRSLSASGQTRSTKSVWHKRASELFLKYQSLLEIQCWPHGRTRNSS